MTGQLLTLLNGQLLAAYAASGYWGDETLYNLAARHARSTPHSFAVRDQSSRRRLSCSRWIGPARRWRRGCACATSDRERAWQN
jgi:non-ribosomal peptide synthetase component E (peptide arylation enzyme)